MWWKILFILISVAAFTISGGFVFADCPPADLTGDCVVDMKDFAMMASGWLNEGVIRYSDLRRADIASMEGQMSTSNIDASNGNEFMPGTYFIYKTSSGRFGKFMVETYEPESAVNYRLTIRWVTYNADGSICTHGTRLIIRGTYYCDLDVGVETTSAGRDWKWNLMTSTTRRLDPFDGAKFKLMHRAKAPAGMVWVYFDEWAVSGFEGYMSKYETTNAQYCQFLNSALATGDITVSGNDVVGANGTNIGDDFAGDCYYYLAGAGYTHNGATNGGASRINYAGGVFTVDIGFENHPVTYVSWYGSTAFAEYYCYKLPNEWQWQAVADYDGSYTYGCGTTINNGIANYYGSSHPYGTTVVGAFGTYGYGICDMAGNVWEWTSSCYYPDCADSYRVLRGGDWYYGATYCAVALRINDTPSSRGYGSGFRVCR